MTDEYTARERALTLAHADSRDIILPAEDVIELAEKYLAFLMPPGRPDPLLAFMKAHPSDETFIAQQREKLAAMKRMNEAAA